MTTVEGTPCACRFNGNGERLQECTMHADLRFRIYAAEQGLERCTHLWERKSEHILRCAGCGLENDQTPPDRVEVARLRARLREAEDRCDEHVAAMVEVADVLDAADGETAMEAARRQMEWRRQGLQVLRESGEALQEHGQLGESASDCIRRLAARVAEQEFALRAARVAEQVRAIRVAWEKT